MSLVLGWLSQREALVALSLCAALQVACVQRATYDAAMAELAESREHASVLSHEAEALRADARRCEGSSEKARNEQMALKSANAELTHKVDDLMVLNAELTERLKGAGQNVEQLASERGNLRQALTDTRAELAEWRRQQQVIAVRTAQQQKLALALRPLVESKGLEVGIRNGRVVVIIPSDLFFDPGSTGVKTSGRPVLAQVAAALKDVSGRTFRVAAHSEVAKTAVPWSPNWQLTAGRAMTVARELVSAGVPPDRVSAAAHAEFDPVAPNDTEPGRAKNRRIEIVLVPLPDELVKPGATAGPRAGNVKP